MSSPDASVALTVSPSPLTSLALTQHAVVSPRKEKHVLLQTITATQLRKDYCKLIKQYTPVRTVPL